MSKAERVKYLVSFLLAGEGKGWAARQRDGELIPILFVRIGQAGGAQEEGGDEEVEGEGEAVTSVDRFHPRLLRRRGLRAIPMRNLAPSLALARG